MLFKYGQILDQLDFERLGVEQNWNFSDTVIMLTSFEIEVRGFYDNDDSGLKYNQIHDKYHSYLLECMMRRMFICNDGVDPALKARYSSEPDDLPAVNPSRATFDRNVLLNFLEDNYPGKIDINRLKRIMSGQEELEHGGIEQKEPDDKGMVELPKSKNEKMSMLGDKSHSLRNRLKNEIMKYVKSQIVSPCTCNHAQMMRIIIRLAKDPANAAGITLNLKNGNIISDSVLLATVKAAYVDAGATNRIKDKNVADKRCPKHSRN
jgi:hypothetical protein